MAFIALRNTEMTPNQIFAESLCSNFHEMLRNFFVIPPQLSIVEDNVVFFKYLENE